MSDTSQHALMELSPMPLLPITSPQTVQLCDSLPLRPNDIFICSYPKSGTTWTQHIVLSLLVKAANNKSDNNNDKAADTTRKDLDYKHVSEYAPFYEIDPHWDAQTRDLIPSIRANHARLGQRVFNTHLRWDMLPKECKNVGETEKAKFLYLIRSPMDVCTSFYYHLVHQEQGGYEGDFDAFFADWIEGKIAFGSYLDHVLSFGAAFAKDNNQSQEVLLVSYEEMLSDLPSVVARIAKFIQVDLSDDDLQELLPTFGFSHMKSNLDRFQPKSVTWKNDFQFLRKGVSGDSLNVASEAQRRALKTIFEKRDFVGKLESLLANCNPDVLQKILRVCVHSL